MEPVTVAVGTYGAPEWRDLAYSRAIPSVPESVRIIHRHGTSLAQARNEALALVDTEFVIFLDADDELEAGYVEAMLGGAADLRAPLVRYGDAGAAFPRVVGHEHLCSAPCLSEGNWVAIGACVRADLVREVGGFQEEPIWEDWSLWLRCWRAGASVEAIPAIYHAFPGSRNASLSRAERLRVFEQIAA